MAARRTESSYFESLPDETPDSRVRVRVRRPQQVVVRAGSVAAVRVGESDVRSPSATPTLIGLDVCERQETLLDAGEAAAPMASGVIEHVAPLEPSALSEPSALPEPASELADDWLDDAETLLALKRRPLVIREGLDDRFVEQYRAQAERILASGLFAPGSG